MKIQHPNITSPLFKLLDVYEFGIEFIGSNYEDAYTLRIELFKSVSDGHLYRCKYWRTEFCRLQPTFPIIIDNEPDVLDAEIFVPEGQPHMTSGEFKADNDEEALNIVINSFSKSMEHITSIKPEISQ